MISTNTFDPFYLMLALVALSLLPFVAIMVTSYIKISIVLSLTRNALGIQQIPPNMVINGLAVILSIYVMAPVGQEIYDILVKAVEKKGNTVQLLKSIVKAKEPLRKFLLKHSKRKERLFFVHAAKDLWQNESAGKLKHDDLVVLIPAFTVNELASAFKIGFLIYLPFVVIDLIISNILLAMGMIMLSPMMISLPFKLLLFVLTDGWTKLIHGLVLTFR